MNDAPFLAGHSTTNENTLGFKEFLSGITGYATGGFPEDGLFYANHGELVGKFSNGRTAVANNAQITDGIRQAAYEGMMQAIKDSGGISGNVNVSVEADTNGLFRVVQKKANEHFKTTGNPTFMF